MDDKILGVCFEHPEIIKDVLDAEIIYDDGKLRSIYNIYTKTKKLPNKEFLEKEFGKFDATDADVEWVYEKLEEWSLEQYNLRIQDALAIPGRILKPDEIKEYEKKYVREYTSKVENSFTIKNFDDIIKLKNTYDGREEKFIPTGFDSLSEITGGGWRQGSLYTVMGLSGFGKSIFLSNFARAAWKLSNVLYITTEMDHIQTYERILKSYYGVQTFEEIVLKKHLGIPDNIIHVVKVHPNDTTCLDLQDIIDELDWTPELIVIDYADELKSHEKTNSEYDSQGIVYAGLKKLAEVNSVPVITATQTNRSAEHENGGTKNWVGYSAIADSSKKIRLVDILFSITQSISDKEESRLNLLVLKNRFGESNKQIYFTINYKTMRLLETSDRTHEEKNRTPDKENKIKKETSEYKFIDEENERHIEYFNKLVKENTSPADRLKYLKEKMRHKYIDKQDYDKLVLELRYYFKENS